MNDTAFVIHLYYIEMLDELCRCLDELRRHMDFDVFVTTQANYADINTLREITQRLQAKDVEIVENRGRVRQAVSRAVRQARQ
jgi:lipopolysaccharide biosynthesis protein